MALPKKKTSKARSRRRFSQYETKRTEKLIRVSNTLRQIDRPFIFDRKATPVVSKEENKETTSQPETKKKKLNIEKVDKIEVKEAKKDKKTTEVVEVKQDTKEVHNEEKESPKKEEKGQWFKNLFNLKKNSSGNQVKDLSQKGQKKVFRRKAM